MLKSAQTSITDVTEESFSSQDADNRFLYHVTSEDRVPAILAKGLSPKSKQTIQGGAYQNYSRGKTFLTDRAGVNFWMERIEQHLEHAHDDPPPIAVLQVPISLVKDIQIDEPGSEDSQSKAYFTEQHIAPSAPAVADPGKINAADRKAIDALPFAPLENQKTQQPLLLFHGTRVMPEFTEFSCDGPVFKEDGERMSTGSGYDVTAFMGAHFAKEYSTAMKFATGEGWMRTRFDGHEMNPRVLRCATAAKKLHTFESEAEIRNACYRESISDDQLLEDAMLRELIDFDSPEAEEWLETYDRDESKRVEVNRWMLEVNGPRQEERGDSYDAYTAAARDLAAAAAGKLKKEGWEGIVYRNEVEGGVSVIVFDPEKIAILSTDYLKGKTPSLDHSIQEGDIAESLIRGGATLQAPAKPRFTQEQGHALDQITRGNPGFWNYARDSYDNQDDADTAMGHDEERHALAKEYLEDAHEMRVDEHGVVNFNQLTKEARTMIGELPVRLYHHTATAVEARIKKHGLRPITGADVNCLGSGSGGEHVFLTTEAGGNAPDVYLGTAMRKHGGEPLTLEVVMRLDEMQPDPDDSDIVSGRVQFIADRVGPDRIENFTPMETILKSVAARVTAPMVGSEEISYSRVTYPAMD